MNAMPEEESYQLQDFNEMEMSMEEERDYDPWRTSVLSDDPSVWDERVTSTYSSFHSTNEGGREETVEEEEKEKEFDECMRDLQVNPQNPQNPQNPLAQREMQSWGFLNARVWSTSLFECSWCRRVFVQNAKVDDKTRIPGY